jgi:hypothetical protein
LLLVHPDELLLRQIIGVFYQSKRTVVPAWLSTSEIFRDLPDRYSPLSTVRRLSRLGLHSEFDWGPSIIIPGYLLEDVQACLEKHFGLVALQKT